ncbi:glutathione S-transferase family protein [Ponticoccus alexandrii]|uniref:Glutathione S-transferase family protein n=1 Tax=Ponticoccus alexandrii TaxID=1943633 RepID=A0ABX7FDL4_9RHOB|nr:glutathione S-transferase family protein [Ponticoccus alexandrii]ETA50599.1 glutathione S-transferase [Rhodobacteraceae bacterium PD-2]QRF68670.1 glutathione S-transferase family protein [Ponticoccus alexandrii]
MITVYGRRNSSNCAKVFWLLDALDQPFTLVPAGRGAEARDPEAVRRLSPTGTVPLVLIGEAVVWESNAVLRCLASSAPASPLWPADAARRGAIDSWMDWASLSLTPPLGRLRKVRAAGQAADAEATVQAFSLLDRHLAGRDYLVGETLTLADIAIAPAVFRWRLWEGSAQDTLPDLPNLLAYRENLRTHAGYRQHVEDALT